MGMRCSLHAQVLHHVCTQLLAHLPLKVCANIRTPALEPTPTQLLESAARSRCIDTATGMYIYTHINIACASGQDT